MPLSIFSEEFDILEAMSQVHPRIDGLEIQIAGTLYPSEKCIQVIKAIQERFDVSITFSPIVCREATSGKQFPRFRLGCTPQEIPMINQYLAGKGVAIDRVICKLNNDQPLCNQIQEIAEIMPLSHISNIDFSLEFSATNDQTNANLAAEVLFSMATMPGSRIYFEPFSDLDRTMDVTHGLLDTLCNPRSASCTLQSLNTIMYSRPLKVSKHPLRLTADKRFESFTVFDRHLDLYAVTAQRVRIHGKRSDQCRSVPRGERGRTVEDLPIIRDNSPKCQFS